MGERPKERSTLFSNVHISSLYGKRLAVITTSTQSKTPLSDSSPFMPQFFSLHFNLNQKINISPPLFSIQIIFHPQPHFTGTSSGPLYVVTLQRKQSYWMLWTSTANLMQASLLLQLHTMFTTALLIKTRTEKKNKSIFICTSGLKWQGVNVPLRMFDFEFPQLPLVWLNLSCPCENSGETLSPPVDYCVWTSS